MGSPRLCGDPHSGSCRQLPWHASCLARDPRPSSPRRRRFSLTPAAEGARRPRTRHAAAQRRTKRFFCPQSPPAAGHQQGGAISALLRVPRCLRSQEGREGPAQLALSCTARLSSSATTAGPRAALPGRAAPSAWSCLASGDPGMGQDGVAVPGQLPGARRAGPCGEQMAEPLTNRKFLITSRSLGYPARAVQRKEAKARGEKVRVRSANRRPVQRSRVHQSKETLMC